jgi:tetratricopeptide (TPR) repeat protein
LVLGVAFLAHAPALWATFVFDDRNDVLDNPSAQAETFLARFPQMSRPLLKASYALQDALHGPSALAFHAVNLGLHLGATALVLLLVRRAAELAGRGSSEAGRLGLVTAALWAVHPASVETVTYVSGRSMGLSTVLVLAVLWAATMPRRHPALTFLAAALAPLARETALAAPLFLLAWQLGPGQREAPRRALSRAAPVWFGALAAALVLAAMPRHRELLGFSFAQRGAFDALRGNLFAIPDMLGLWAAPWQISAVPAQPLIYGWADAPTLLRIALLAGAPLAALALRHRFPLAALATLWTLLAFVPTNSLIWRVDPVAVRPLYLAGLGLSLLVALVLTKARIGMGLAVLLAAGLAILTFTRAGLYADEVALFREAAAKNPGEPRQLVRLGLVLANAGDWEAARAALAEASALDPYDAEARYALRLIEAGLPIYSLPPE